MGLGWAARMSRTKKSPRRLLLLQKHAREQLRLHCGPLAGMPRHLRRITPIKPKK